MMKKILLTVVALLVVLGVIFVTPDKSRNDLWPIYSSETSQLIALKDGAIHIRDTGPIHNTGPSNLNTLVLIHGSNSSLQTWEPWVKSLSADYRIVTIDLPGHGMTGAVNNCDYGYDCMVRIVHEVTEKLELGPFFIGGNSMGGGVSAKYSLTHPTNVVGLILVDATGMVESQTMQSNRPLAFDLATTPVISHLLKYVTPKSIVREGLEKSISNHSLITDEMINRYRDLALMEGNRAATRLRFQFYADKPRIIDAASIKVPTLIIWGEKDQLIPVDRASVWQSLLPISELTIYPDVGHLPMEEIPALSAARAKAFLDKNTMKKAD